MRIEVDPDDGGAITSLRAVDREWLVQVSRRSRNAASDGSYTAHAVGGWDEMFPSIEECRVGGRHIGDHGDAWSRPWESLSADEHRVNLDGVSLTRRIRAEEQGLLLRYEVRSTGADVPFLWAPHPVVCAPPGSRVRVSRPRDEVLVIHPDGTEVTRFDPDLLAIDSVVEGGFRKVIFSPADRFSSAHVRHPDGAELTFRWDRAVVPYLAVYLERKAFTQHDCVAVEPMTGWYDSLERAIENDKVTTARADSRVRWWLKVTARTGREAA